MGPLPLVPLVAALALTGGLATAILLTVGLLRRQRAARAEAVPEAAPTRSDRAQAGIGPLAYRRWLDRRWILSGRMPMWSPGRVVLMKPLITLAITLPALLWVGLEPGPFRFVVALFAITVAFWTPELLLWSRGAERQQKMGLALPDTLDQMTIAVEAGLGFESAMTKAASNGVGPLAVELTRTLQDISIGRTRRSAYEALVERTDSADLRRFVRAVIQADVYGISIGDVLRVQASEMRIKRRQRAEEQAMKVPVKVLFPLMACILPVLFIVILAPAGITALHTLL